MAAETTIARESRVNPVNGISSRTRAYMPIFGQARNWDETSRLVQAVGDRGQALKQRLRRTYPIDGDNDEYNRRIARINRATNSMNRRLLGY